MKDVLLYKVEDMSIYEKDYQKVKRVLDKTENIYSTKELLLYFNINIK